MGSRQLTVGVNNRQDVKIVFVKEALYRGIVVVVDNQLVRKVFNNLNFDVNVIRIQPAGL